MFKQDELVLNYLKDFDLFINKLAHGVCRKCARLEFEDTKQQIILTLLLNGNEYDETKNVSSATYFSQIVINAASSIVRKYWQPKNRANIDTVSLDNFLNKDDESESFISFVSEKNNDCYNPESLIIEKEFYERFNRIYKENLTNFEKKILSYLAKNIKVIDIAKYEKKSKKTIYNAINSIKAKLKIDD